MERDVVCRAAILTLLVAAFQPFFRVPPFLKVILVP
jgi:hypothetical protein